MSIRVTLPNLRGVKFSETKLMRSIGAGLVGRIRERTERGVGPDGGAFRALSPSYAKAKRAALGHSKADLTVSGRMLNDMQARPRPTGVTLSFISGGSGGGSGTFIQRSRGVGAAEKAAFHNLTGRVKRPFFALSDADEEFILDRVSAFIGRQL